VKLSQVNSFYVPHKYVYKSKSLLPVLLLNKDVTRLCTHPMTQFTIYMNNSQLHDLINTGYSMSAKVQ